MRLKTDVPANFPDLRPTNVARAFQPEFCPQANLFRTPECAVARHIHTDVPANFARPQTHKRSSGFPARVLPSSPPFFALLPLLAFQPEL